MISFIDDEANKASRISMEGALNIQCADEIKETLTKKLEEFDTVYVDHEKTSSMDLSYLQILFSAIQTSVNLNKKLFIENASVPKLKELLIATGFSYNSNAEKLLNSVIFTGTDK
jgi:anti-anti-sigma regulatory factor